MAESKKTIIALGITRLDYSKRETSAELTLETRKNIFRKGIESSSRVDWVGNGFRTHSMGIGGGGDFSASLLLDQTKTATQKAIDRQHAEVFTAEKIQELTAKAQQYYESKQDAA
jgi:hypothetical protein